MSKRRENLPGLFRVPEGCSDTFFVIPDADDDERVIPIRVVPGSPRDDGDVIPVAAPVAPPAGGLRLRPSMRAYRDPTGRGDAELVFADRTDANHFVIDLVEFAPEGAFSVSYEGVETHVHLPDAWFPALADHFRAVLAAAQQPHRGRAAASQGATPGRPTVRLMGVEIDQELAPLVASLWFSGIRAGSPRRDVETGTCSIRFPRAEEALKFFVPSSLIVDDLTWSTADPHEPGRYPHGVQGGGVEVEFPEVNLDRLWTHWRPTVEE